MFQIKKSLWFRLIAVCGGVFLSALLLELFLQISGCFFELQGHKNRTTPGERIMLFAGDSWTHGADADPGKSFFALLKEDNDFKKLSLINVGYGGSNCLQVANAIIGFGKHPEIVIVNFGVNSWHLMGVEEFISNAKEYLSPQDVSQLYDDLKLHGKWAWFMRLKIYRFYCYIASARKKTHEIDLEDMDHQLASPAFRALVADFRQTYQDYDAQYQGLPQFLKEAQELNLDQKFYFTALHLGFDSKGSEDALRKAGMFYPEKLNVFPYEVYRSIGVTKRRLDDPRALFLKWSFKLLKAWALRKHATIFVQTYPDIKKENQGENSFDKVNELLKSFARANGFKIIDQNAGGVEWKKYRTPWHVNDEGHKLMKDNIKFFLRPYISGNGALD